MKLIKDKEFFSVTKKEKKDVTGVKNTKKALKLIPIDKKALCIVLIFFTLSITVQVITALITKDILSAFTSGAYEKFLYLTIYLFLANLFYYIVEFIYGHFYDVFLCSYTLGLENKTYDRITMLKASCFTNNQTSTYTRRLADASAISNSYKILLRSVYHIAVSLAYCIVLIIYTPILFAVTSVFYLIKIILYKYIIPKHNALNKKNKKTFDRINNIAIETIRGANDIKSLNISQGLKNEFSDSNDTAFSQSLSITLWWRKRLLPTNFIAFALNSSVLLGLIAICAINKIYIIDTLLFFWMHKNFINVFFTQVIDIKEQFASVEVSASRLMELYDEELFPIETFGDKNIDVKGDINFKNVSFGYEKGKPVLKNINLNIEANKITALVGKTGCGKSTTLSLIARFYDAKKGKITLDGVDIKDLSKDCLRTNIGYVQQSPYIFNRTFKENLLLVNPKATDKEIMDACKKSELHSFIMQTTDKYDTLIGENGITLSGGQKQRLAIARALLNNSKIIMFDESTSSLDNENQAKIQATIENLAKDHTIIVVAHRLSTIINADKIILMDDHKVVAEGTHEELFNNCEEYKKLYEIENI